MWRGILLNMFLAAWGKKKNGIYCAVVVSSLIWSVPLPESASGTELCRYDKTGIVCDLFWHVSGSTFIYRRIIYSFRFLYMDFVIFLIFFMNEILGWNYTVWKYDDILQGVLAVFYLIAGLYVVYRSVQKKQNIRRKTEK